MNYRNLPWVVLFGGAGREEVIISMRSSGLKIEKVITPKKQSLKLSSAISKLKSTGFLINEVSRNELRPLLEPLKKLPIITLGFPYIIPKDVFQQHPIALNVHPTLLPKYRGPTSGAYILINAEKVSGSTVHLLDEEMDKGAIVMQKEVSLSPFDTLRSMQKKVYAIEPELVVEAISRLDYDHGFQSQDEDQASTYPKVRKPIDSEIDPSKPLNMLINEIRACDPNLFPAFFIYLGEKVCIKLWRPIKDEEEFDEI